MFKSPLVIRCFRYDEIFKNWWAVMPNLLDLDGLKKD